MRFKNCHFSIRDYFAWPMSLVQPRPAHFPAWAGFRHTSACQLAPSGRTVLRARTRRQIPTITQGYNGKSSFPIINRRARDREGEELPQVKVTVSLMTKGWTYRDGYQAGATCSHEKTARNFQQKAFFLPICSNFISPANASVCVGGRFRGFGADVPWRLDAQGRDCCQVPCLIP